MLVVDDDDGVRQFMATALELGGLGVICAASGEAALELVRTERVDVLVLDVHLPGISGYEVCRQVREDLESVVGILFVSGERTESFDRVAGLLIGGDDYLVKPFAPDELVARTRRLVRRSANRDGGGGRLAERLTPRELEVLRLLADGLAQPAIADRLVISPKTVETHIERILAKLAVHSRAQAVAVAYRDDLLGMSSP